MNKKTQQASSGLKYLSGNFGPVATETTAFDLAVEGRIPQELHADIDDELDAHMAENEKLRAGAE